MANLDYVNFSVNDLVTQLSNPHAGNKSASLRDGLGEFIHVGGRDVRAP